LLTNRQTNKQRQKDNLLGGVNDVVHVYCRLFLLIVSVIYFWRN